MVKTIIVHLLKPNKWYINELNFLQNPKNTIFGVFLVTIPKMRFFSKNPASSVFYLYGTLTLCKVSERLYELFRDLALQTDGQTDRQTVVKS